MDITQELIDDLNAVITIKLTPEDYQGTVKKVLTDYRRKANIPGFRPGQVPFGMVKKMYGEAVMAEEINKILSNNLHEYINKEKLDILGNPIPNKDEQLKDSLVDGETYEFKYDIGLAPQFEIKLDGKTKMDYYKIIVDDELVNKYTTDLSRRYGSMKEVDVVGDSDMINGNLDELDSKGNKVEGGIHSHANIAIDYLEKDKSKKALIGKKVGDTLVINPRDFSKGDADLAAMLHVEKDQLDKVGKKFQLTIERIHELTPAEINQEFFDKIFGPGNVKNEKEFKEKLSEDLGKTLANDSDKIFVRDLQEKLKAKLKIQIPGDFLKRWMEMTNEEATAESLEKEWDKISAGMEWQLIENRIINAHNVEVSYEDAFNRTKELFKAQMASYGNEIEDADLEKAAQNYLAQNKEDAENIYQQLYSEKLLNLYKETLSVKEKEVSFDDFVKLATGNTAKKGILDSLSNLVKM